MIKMELEDLSVKQLQEIINAAFNKAAKEAMEIMGYVVFSENGWVVKKYKDGRKEKICKI